MTVLHDIHVGQVREMMDDGMLCVATSALIFIGRELVLGCVLCVSTSMESLHETNVGLVSFDAMRRSWKE